MTLRTILGICGSLRKNSYNASALQAAAELMPANWRMQLADYGAIPLYNQDIEDQGLPAAVTALAGDFAAADGILIASPEYNYSISGVLKNALDWLSRVPSAPLNNRPIALLSATAGPVGGARHQYELRKILGALNAQVLNRPEVFIGTCHAKFDQSGKLADAVTRDVIAAQMLAFEAWIERAEKIAN